MKTIVKAGLAMGLVTVAWTFVMGVSGWYKHPSLRNLFWLVVPFEIIGLVVALRFTRASRGYGAQVGAGTAMSVISGLLAFAGSLLFTTVVFPRYFEELRALDGPSPAQTPLASAGAGLMGTIVTGLVASLVIAAFVRHKPAAT